MTKLIYGAGINDADYCISFYIDNKRTLCPFYRKWVGMLERCFSLVYHARQPTYINCTVCKEWLYFSVFKIWMEQQDWVNKELDKDLLFPGNKHYSPETCIFVDKKTNTFINSNESVRGLWPIGVSFKKEQKKFQATCKNTFTGKREFLGYYLDPESAHKAWKKRKHTLACQLANQQTNSKIAEILRNLYAN